MKELDRFSHTLNYYSQQETTNCVSNGLPRAPVSQEHGNAETGLTRWQRRVGQFNMWLDNTTAGDATSMVARIRMYQMARQGGAEGDA